MTGLLYLPYLTSLDLGSSKLALHSQALSQLTGLTAFNIGSARLNSINLSGLTALQWLGVDNNNLTSLDLSSQT